MFQLFSSRSGVVQVHHARQQLQERGDVAAENGHVLHLVACDDAGALRTGRLHGGALGRDLHEFGNRAHLQHHLAGGERLGRREVHASFFVAFEASGFHTQVVFAGLQAAEEEGAGFIGRHLALLAGGYVDERDIRGGDGQAAGVHHRTHDRAGNALRIG